MFNLSHNPLTMKNFRHIAVTVTLSNIDSSHLTFSIYNDNNQNNWKQRRSQMSISNCHMFSRPRIFCLR